MPKIKNKVSWFFFFILHYTCMPKIKNKVSWLFFDLTFYVSISKPSTTLGVCKYLVSSAYIDALPSLTHPRGVVVSTRPLRFGRK